MVVHLIVVRQVVVHRFVLLVRVNVRLIHVRLVVIRTRVALMAVLRQIHVGVVRVVKMTHVLV